MDGLKFIYLFHMSTAGINFTNQIKCNMIMSWSISTHPLTWNSLASSIKSVVMIIQDHKLCRRKIQFSQELVKTQLPNFMILKQHMPFNLCWASWHDDADSVSLGCLRGHLNPRPLVIMRSYEMDHSCGIPFHPKQGGLRLSQFQKQTKMPSVWGVISSPFVRHPCLWLKALYK